MKNKVIIVIIVIACLIPSVVAVLNYRNTKDAPVDMSTATTVTIDDITGRSYTFDRASADENERGQAEALINFFMKLNTNASPIAGLPDSLLGEKFYKVTMANAARKESYEYYFSSDPNICYYRSQDGKTYKIKEDDAKSFLLTEYAESVYGDSTMPVLTVASSQVVTPDSAIWQYKNFSGDFVDANTSSFVKNELESYELEGGLDLDFSLVPDYCSVKVAGEDGEKVWEGMLDSISEISLDKAKNVTVTIVSKWYEDSARSFCGEINYAFSTVLTAPASFYISTDEIRAGKFITITATNVFKPEGIELTSDMPVTVKPVFYKAEDNMAVGFLPIDIDTPAGDYTLTLKYGGASETIALNVEANVVTASGFVVSEAMLSSARSTAALSEFDGVASDIMSKGSDERYFKGYFLEGVGTTAMLTRGFGRDVYVNNSTSVTYRNNGVDYSASAGIDVVAANNGVVVYAGLLDYSGYTVVIEHGYGLKTWYYNMSVTSVEVGTQVTRGDKIGETGSTGFCATSGVHIAMSVGNTFVCPYDTWADSDDFGKVVIPKIDELKKDEK